jgi:hypothetical protein
MPSGTEAAKQIVETLAVEVGVLVQRRVEIRHIRLMMLAVVNLHRLRIDVRLERSGVVGKSRKRMSH